ncbi:MAG: class I SAM-dependent methyltransferase [bacterium]|nr:class I SAM-dependent methyltransferase [bacterium]
MVRAGRIRAVKHINNSKAGRVLEVGVGTGLSLPHYRTDLEVTGIDLSPEMLEKAQDRMQNKNLTHVDDLLVMDASDLDFPDNSFDTVVAMFVMTVVPDPVAVMRELQRVCAPGGEVLLVNHFSADEGVRGWVEQKMASFKSTGLWNPEFPVDRVMVCDELELRESYDLHPFGLFKLLSFTKLEDEMARNDKQRLTTRATTQYAPSTAQAGL